MDSVNLLQCWSSCLEWNQSDAAVFLIQNWCLTTIECGLAVGGRSYENPMAGFDMFWPAGQQILYILDIGSMQMKCDINHWQSDFTQCSIKNSSYKYRNRHQWYVTIQKLILRRELKKEKTFLRLFFSLAGSLIADLPGQIFQSKNSARLCPKAYSIFKLIIWAQISLKKHS